MRTQDRRKIKRFMEDLLERIDEVGAHPAWCHSALAEDMAKAAALVYDTSMNAQVFADEQRQ